MCISIRRELLEVIPLVILNIGLPTADVFSDMYVIITLYQSSHPGYATALLTPLLSNVISTAISWSKLDSTREKKWTWVLLVMQVWPQYRTIKIIIKMFKGDHSYEEEKNVLQRDVSILEPFLESVPTVWITTMILGTSVYLRDGDCKNYEALFGEDGGEMSKFIASFTLSVIASSIGIAKFLKIGPCRIFPDGGICLGYITGRFLLSFFVIGCSIVSKGLLISLHLILRRNHGSEDPDKHFIPSPTGTIITFLVINIFPHLLWSLALVWMALKDLKSVSNLLKTYPQIFLIGGISPFVFGATQLLCCNSRANEIGRITFTKQGTTVNVIINLMGIAITLSLIISEDLAHLGGIWGHSPGGVFLPSILPAIMLVVMETILTIVIMTNSQCYFGSRHEECCALQYHTLYVPTAWHHNNQTFEFEHVI